MKKHALRLLRKDDGGQWHLLIIAIVEMPYTVNGILDHYAEVYCFEREKLAGYVSDILDLSDIHQ